MSSRNEPFEILYQDERLVAVNKPEGLFVHRSAFDRRSRDLVLPKLRNQLGRWVQPVHRLDRATSGVLVFALDKDATREMMGLFRERAVDKRYLAVVRGHLPAEGVSERPVEGAEARTTYRRLAKATLPYPVGKFPSARVSLASLHPETGRRHQLRRHTAGMSYPILGDSTHGDTRQNRAFRDHTGLDRLMLHALYIRFVHPFGGAPVEITAPVPAPWRAWAEDLGWGPLLGGDTAPDAGVESSPRAVSDGGEE